MPKHAIFQVLDLALMSHDKDTFSVHFKIHHFIIGLVGPEHIHLLRNIIIQYFIYIDNTNYI